MIEGLDEFFVEVATGRTKAQIQEDVNNVQATLAELSGLMGRIEFGHTEIQKQKDTLKQLQVEISDLEKIKRKRNEILEQSEKINESIKLSKEEKEELEKSNKRLISDIASLESTLDAKEKRYAFLCSEDIRMVQDRQELVTRAREIEIEIEKNKKILLENSRLLTLLELEREPIYKHVIKIQDALDSKGIKFDVLKSIQ